MYYPDRHTDPFQFQRGLQLHENLPVISGCSKSQTASCSYFCVCLLYDGCASDSGAGM